MIMTLSKLQIILKKGYWVQVNPMGDSEDWILAIYKKEGKNWVTDECKNGFKDPKAAYDWAFDRIKEERI